MACFLHPFWFASNWQLGCGVVFIYPVAPNTQFMLFNINDLIEDLSTVFTLEAGDIIATGTPAGVGAGRDPQEWLHDGDVVEATVEGIGTIVNTIKEI
jgi:2-keto-4-pentenoate hydratase/2-oxohepta-3-ene-1,7-dioic acid hydratase in catechol pathway